MAAMLGCVSSLSTRLLENHNDLSSHLIMRAVSFHDMIVLYFAFPVHGGVLAWDRYGPGDWLSRQTLFPLPT